jgi:hypothetical protein
VEPTAVLTALGSAIWLPSPQKEDRLHAAAASLGLRHLATFVERLAIPPA